HAGAVCIVRTRTAVAVAIEPSGIAAGPTIALARDQIGERLVTELRIRRWKRLHGSLSLPLEARAGWALVPAVASSRPDHGPVHGPEYTEKAREATRGGCTRSHAHHTRRPDDPDPRGRQARDRCLYLAVHAQHPRPPRRRWQRIPPVPAPADRGAGQRPRGALRGAVRRAHPGGDGRGPGGGPGEGRAHPAVPGGA